MHFKQLLLLQNEIEKDWIVQKPLCSNAKNESRIFCERIAADLTTMLQTNNIKIKVHRIQ
jgi:hypothetical protein